MMRTVPPLQHTLYELYSEILNYLYTNTRARILRENPRKLSVMKIHLPVRLTHTISLTYGVI